MSGQLIALDGDVCSKVGLLHLHVFKILFDSA
jgi:hypothetical protein